jgi:FMN phosphatase YigB (HAD superfamily)
MACFILDLDDTVANTTRDLEGDLKKLKSLTLVRGAAQFLEKYGKKSVILTMGYEPEQRAKVEALYLDRLVRHVHIVASYKKKQEWLERLVTNNHEHRQTLVVVGDRVDQEIRMGNELDLTTVRMRLPHGKYFDRDPSCGLEKPDYTVSDFFELMKLPLTF